MFDVFVLGNEQPVTVHMAHSNIIKRIDLLEAVNYAAKNSTTSHFWILDNQSCYDNFDFSFEPAWHQSEQLHVWPSNNQTHGGFTLLVNRKKWIDESPESLLEYSVINWHDQSVKRNFDAKIFIWDLGGHDHNVQHLLTRFPEAKTLRYFGTHLDMIKKTVHRSNNQDCWVLSSCCDYENFDPDWLPDWNENEQLHVWASGNQKFGDTFFIPAAVESGNINDLEELEYYNKGITWHRNGYMRHTWPINYLETQDLYTTINTHRFTSLYEYFIAPGSTVGSSVDISLWKNRKLVAYNKNGHVVLSPRDVISAISDKILSYPYIQYHKCKKSTQIPQDIVFISYDEKDADLNWKKLKKQQPNATRLHGVDGMINALKLAADKSNTPWFYAVFAKTEIADDFDFDFNPNYLDTPGNYIFQAYNRITDYTYGHGAVVMYHSKTVSEATTWGYDFTTSFPYTHIPILSCYNDAKTPWEAWRTSFREALKLREMNTVESEYRLHRWLTVGNGIVGNWSISGAKDAVEYNGSLDQANDWNWLRQYFTNKYQLNQ